ncbi:MAG: GAF domain-containing protein [Bacteroidales bacterium]|nr:GAF domain-containing protein [Bacteroidales bacterium]
MVNFLNISLKKRRRKKDSSIPSEPIRKQKIENILVEDFMRDFVFPFDNPEQLAQSILSGLAKHFEILQGIFLEVDETEEVNALRYLGGYACAARNVEDYVFQLGEGLPGQVAVDRKLLNLNSIPEGYLSVRTGLGEAKPNSLIIFPIQFGDKLWGVIELASFHSFREEDETFFIHLSNEIGGHLEKLDLNFQDQ